MVAHEDGAAGPPGERRVDPGRSTLGLVARAVAGTAGLAVLAGLIALAIAAVFGWGPP